MTKNSILNSCCSTSANLRESLSWTIANIHAKDWATGTGGNFSAVLNRDPLTLLMAPSGVDKGLIQPADLIEVDAKGKVIQGNGRASAETYLHLAIIEKMGAGAVLHTHSIFSTLLSEHFCPQGKLTISGYEMLKGLEGIITHEEIINIPILPNSQNMHQLQHDIRSLLHDKPCFYGLCLSGHGLYTWGDTLFQARRHLEILEFLFELTYRKLTLAIG
ncbi:methylthioribulose 1-phosphate dehydratase [Nostoc sp. UHCC 0251]|uniref:methylthioribulose 1-phosphate dehydratase n=1 Tax=Nostoc sp. UHCC 0251 TaxID=3110240 RepID=UPI002B1E98BB|nr:methylthioribulose 1-phosphate dehydratase [Nostoc sp. UHCC 0251]MEA5621829.1 methylthioribulose 1-phosphate dehydratase [Nostoc sp. UHCC 0251]